MIIQRFLNFKKQFGNNIFSKLNDFFDKEKEIFYNEKIPYWMNQGYTNNEAVIKARQGWISTIGRNLEKVIEILIKDFCNENSLKVTNDKILKRRNLPVELDLVKRLILVHFGQITKHIKVFMITPDKDDEISFSDNPRKSRIVIEYELDGIYLAKDRFDSSNKIKSINMLIDDLKVLI